MTMDTYESTEEVGEIITMGGPRNTGCQSFWSRHWRSIIRCHWILIFVLVLVILVMALKPKADTDIPHIGQTSAQTLLQQIDTHSLRIDPDVYGCEEPLCVACKAQVLRSQNNDDDHSHCPVNPEDPVKNASCFECNGECKSLTDLLKFLNVYGSMIECRNDPKEITCCKLSWMGNAGQFCGPGGSYNCYGDRIPKCKCPQGREGDRCEHDAKITLNCSCFMYPLCGQNEMVECEHENEGLEDSPCHMTVERVGQSYNCVCHIPSGDSDLDADTCGVPNSRSLKNGSEKLSYSLYLLTILVIYMIRTVDKT